MSVCEGPNKQPPPFPIPPPPRGVWVCGGGASVSALVVRVFFHDYSTSCQRRPISWREKILTLLAADSSPPHPPSLLPTPHTPYPWNQTSDLEKKRLLEQQQEASDWPGAPLLSGVGLDQSEASRQQQWWRRWRSLSLSLSTSFTRPSPLMLAAGFCLLCGLTARTLACVCVC